jgi:hypothetical protein
MAQRFVRIQVLHPDRGALAVRIDAVVLVQRRIAEDGAPEAEVDRVGLGGHRHLDLLDRAPVGRGPVLARQSRDGFRDLEVACFSAPHLARELHGEAVGCCRQQGSRLEARDIGHRSG